MKYLVAKARIFIGANNVACIDNDRLRDNILGSGVFKERLRYIDIVDYDCRFNDSNAGLRVKVIRSNEVFSCPHKPKI